jgi:hypothetical protein
MNHPAIKPAIEGDVLERDVTNEAMDQGALAVISKAEIDMQIATAHRFPRSVSKFIEEATSLVSLNEEVADECVYALPRGDKNIEGPSARFAEIVVSSWGNCRAGARVIDEGAEFVTAQGVFHDLQKNVFIAYEVKRRIQDKQGRRFNLDMIGVTANAACSIALRNAILKGVPKAFWVGPYEKARATIMGDFKTLANRRAESLAAFQKFGIKPEQVFEKLQVRGEEDITLEHILVLRGMLTALKEGDTSPDDLFPKTPAQGDRSGPTSLKAAIAGNGAAKESPLKSAAKAEDRKEEKDKADGTPAKRDEIVTKLKSAGNMEKLELERDQANGYAWTKPDMDVIQQAYETRKRELDL